MELEIGDETRGSIEIITILPPDLAGLVLMTAVPIALQGETFKALLQEFKGTGFSAWFARYWMERPTVLTARGNMPVLELRIAWENQVEGTWDKIVQPSLKPHFFSLSFTPHVLTRAVFAGQQQYATFDIHFDLSFLASLGFDYATLDLFLQQVQKDQPAELSAIPHPCPGEMVDAVQAILNNSYSLKARPHLLEYKVKEILLSALEAIGRSELQLLPFALQPRDIEALHQAKAFIREQLPDWPSPTAICRATGLNELKLKIGFKHLFRLTPYDYYIELKMQEAKRLLLEGKESIVSIAYLSGYDHPSSFCREFKKAFGYTPGYFRQHGNY